MTIYNWIFLIMCITVNQSTEYVKSLLILIYTPSNLNVDTVSTCVLQHILLVGYFMLHLCIGCVELSLNFAVISKLFQKQRI